MKQLERPLTIFAVILAAPFALLWIFRLLFWAIGHVIPPVAATPFIGIFYLPPYFLSTLFRYALLSSAALVAGLAASALLVARHRGRVWRVAGFRWTLVGLATVVVFPFLASYRPPVNAASTAQLLAVEPLTLAQRVAKDNQSAAELRPYVIEPLGWADEQTLVYRTWRGAGYYGQDWRDGEPGTPLAYSARDGWRGPWTGSLSDLYHAPCNAYQCARDLLTTPTGRSQPYFTGHYADALPSPDGRWYAFVTRNFYGPEDLVIIGAKE